MSTLSTAPVAKNGGKSGTITLIPDRPRRVTLPNGLGVDMMVRVVSGQPTLGIIGGKLVGLERDFFVASGGNFMPVFDQDQIHIRLEPERVATLQVSVSGGQVHLVS